MADTATVRREARRRKILENSHNRLQFISGKNDNETCKEPIATQIPIETTEYSLPKENTNTNKYSVNNGMINANEEPFSFLSTNHESFAIGDGDITISNHELAAFMSSNSSTPTIEPTQAATFLEKIANYKYDIVLLSFLIQLLNSFSLVTFEETYFFLPLFMYVTTKNFWFPKQHNNIIVANALLLLNGMSASRVQKIMSIMQYVSAFSQDVCVFLFTTICIQSFWQNIRGSLS